MRWVKLYGICSKFHNIENRSRFDKVTEFKGGYFFETRMMANDKNLSYYDRLKKFGLTTLETRRLRGDLIEVYKLFKGYDDVDFNVFFKLSSTHLRGHELKIYKPRTQLDVRKYFFSIRVIDE